MRFRIVAVAIAAVVAPSTAFAHPGHGVVDFSAGFLHPLTGLDHLLAMLMVGVVAYRLGGRARWIIPFTFILGAALGGALAAAGVELFAVEIGIALSVVALGALAVVRMALPFWAMLGAVGCFSIFHGHAHMAEMPGTATGMSYAAGFLVMTALLHGAGLGLGLAADRARAIGPGFVRTIGGAVCVVGIALLTAAL